MLGILFRQWLYVWADLSPRIPSFIFLLSSVAASLISHPQITLINSPNLLTCHSFIIRIKFAHHHTPWTLLQKVTEEMSASVSSILPKRFLIIHLFSNFADFFNFLFWQKIYNHNFVQNFADFRRFETWHTW